jgi:hypothetical protein
MPKVADPIPSRSFHVTVVGDDLESLHEIVNESRRLKPEWHDTPQSVISSIVEDFLGQADAFDQFVLTRVDSEQRALLRQIAELKGLKRAVKTGTLDEPEEAARPNPGAPVTTSNPRSPDPDAPAKATPPALAAGMPATH